MGVKKRFKFGAFYQQFTTSLSNPWSNLCKYSPARPCANFIFWLLCHKKLATKSRLYIFGFITDIKCNFCDEEKTYNHLFFDCIGTRRIWLVVLEWLQISHRPNHWDEELPWIIKMGKGKGWRAKFFKLAIMETVYGTWNHRNRIAFGKASDHTQVIDGIIEKITYRGWFCKDLKNHIASLMVN
ncbi:uncharacterized protein LOC131627308 [Vicia villosa]|uniref:uncharacterized protein LOC131627308 n=1 Tax=Vicia villosa TaxID=3911 RepID=UPI00273C9317|nr:uncharacterized protein LOC131627308 [Vicia villosa]